MWLIWIMLALDSGNRSSSLLLRRQRSGQAFLRSTTQRFLTGVNPELSSSRILTSIAHRGRSQGGPAKVWPGAEGTGSSTLSDPLLSNGEIIIQLHSRWPFD